MLCSSSTNTQAWGDAEEGEECQADPGVWVNLGSDGPILNRHSFIHSLTNSLRVPYSLIHSSNLHQVPDPHRHWRPNSDQDLFPRKKPERLKCGHCHKGKVEMPVREAFLEEATNEWRSGSGQREVA